MNRLLCLASTLWETVSWSAFWRSLIDGGPLVVADGHLWPWPLQWRGPVVRPDGTLVERDVSRCARCGQEADGWRRWWGS